MAKTTTKEMFEAITARVIDLIENSEGRWQKPWQTVLGAEGIPTNAVTRKPYQGVNIIVLWATALNAGYEAPLWATYKQWQSIGAQVRKGEKATYGIKWGHSYKCQDCERKGMAPCPVEGHVSKGHLWASEFAVFNAAQVDGYEVPTPDLTSAPERLAAVEEFIAALGADIRHVAGDRAYYSIDTDIVVLPLREQFETAPGYYGTLLHELTHWTGHKSRLDREQSNPFGSEKYAGEELIAELGSVFLAAHFGIEAEPHIDHANYLRHWLRVLRSDPMNIYRASKAASKATEYLLGHVAGEVEAEETEDIAA